MQGPLLEMEHIYMTRFGYAQIKSSYWPIVKYINAIFWKLLATFNIMWQHLETVVKFCLLATLDNFLVTSTNFCHHLGTFGNIQQVLATFGDLYQHLTTIGNTCQHLTTCSCNHFLSNLKKLLSALNILVIP